MKDSGKLPNLKLNVNKGEKEADIHKIKGTQQFKSPEKGPENK